MRYLVQKTTLFARWSISSENITERAVMGESVTNPGADNPLGAALLSLSALPPILQIILASGTSHLPPL